MSEVTRANMWKDYTKFWVWFAIVTTLFVVAYRWAIHPVWSAFTGNVSGMDLISSSLPNALVEYVLPAIVGLLLWWRTIKVLVLHGAPLSVGLVASEGRQDDGKAGRKVVCPRIGDPRDHEGSPGLLMFAILIAHPSSDKLMRYRLDTLCLAMPCGRSLLIRESRIFWQKMTTLQRSSQYKGRTEPFIRRVEMTTTEMFRSTVVEGMRALRDGLPRLRQNSDDDGLHWSSYPSGDGVVMDDHGNGVRFRQIEVGETEFPIKMPDNTTYFVTEIAPVAGMGTTVSSWGELQELVAEKLKRRTPL